MGVGGLSGWAGRGVGGLLGWVVAADEVAIANALKQLERAEVIAQAGLAGPFVGESVRPLIALNANMGRDPVDVHVPMLECAIVEFAHSEYKCAV
jgi:hypothetical protein